MSLKICGIFNVDYRKDMAIFRTKFHWFALFVGLILLFTAPLYLGLYLLSVLNMICISAITVIGLSILTGYTGQISLGQAAFMGVGAYASAFLTDNGVPFLIALPCAGIITGLVGLSFGLPSLRLKGFYLAMTTLAAQFIIVWIMIHWESVTGGIHGLPVSKPRIFGLVVTGEGNLFILILSVTIAMIYFAQNIIRSKIGRNFIAIRDNDIAAALMGIDIFKYKLLSFFISSIYAGIAGSLWAHYLGNINGEQFPLIDSIWYLGMIIVGGLGSIVGSVFGVILIRVLGEVVMMITPNLGKLFPAVSDGIGASLGLIVFGLTIILFLIFEPRGLAYRWEIIKSYFRLWPFPY